MASPAKIFAGMERDDFLGLIGKAIGEDDMSWWPEEKDLSPRDILEARANGMWEMYMQLLDERRTSDEYKLAALSLGQKAKMMTLANREAVRWAPHAHEHR